MQDRDWQIHDSKFTSERFDLETGIKTSWEKDISAKSTTRRDAFPHGYPLRVIYDVNNPEINNVGKRYSIYDMEYDGTERSASLHIRGNNQEFEIGLSTREEPDAHFHFEAHYRDKVLLVRLILTQIVKNPVRD